MNLIRYCVNQDIWFFALPESCSSSTAELPVEPKQIETGGFFSDAVLLAWMPLMVSTAKAHRYDREPGPWAHLDKI